MVHFFAKNIMNSNAKHKKSEERIMNTILSTTHLTKQYGCESNMVKALDFPLNRGSLWRLLEHLVAANPLC